MYIFYKNNFFFISLHKHMSLSFSNKLESSTDVQHSRFFFTHVSYIIQNRILRRVKESRVTLITTHSGIISTHAGTTITEIMSSARARSKSRIHTCFFSMSKSSICRAHVTSRAKSNENKIARARHFNYVSVNYVQPSKKKAVIVGFPHKFSWW